jgi:hypothetical protein
MIPVRVVLLKTAPDISAFVSVAVVRLEPVKLAPTRDTPERSMLVKFAFCVIMRGPRKYPYDGRATYAADGSVAVSTPTRPPPHIRFVTLAPVKFVFVTVVFVNVAPVRFAFVRFAPAIDKVVNALPLVGRENCILLIHTDREFGLPEFPQFEFISNTIILNASVKDISHEWYVGPLSAFPTSPKLIDCK